MMQMIYVACPGNYATGGIELLHQLCCEIRSYVPAKIWYMNGNDSPHMPQYNMYGNEYEKSDFAPSVTNDVVIFPEIWGPMAAEYEHGVVYWESVDNYISRFPIGRIFPESTIHLVQSEYARRFVSEYISTNVIEVTDYLNSDFLKAYPQTERKPYVLFNPAKGMEFTRKIIDQMPDITFVPLEGLSREKLIELMRTSKVYIDFGNHPGKDRLPREAAMCGCCVIVGRAGSAKFFRDVPIPEKYKLDFDLEQIEPVIRRTLDTYPVDDFDGYRIAIRDERKRFEEGVRNFLKKLEGI